MKTILISVLLILSSSVLFSQSSKPLRTMTYIKFRLEGPGLNEITSKSKEMWRVGDSEMRTLEPADPERKVQPLMIYNPPDHWMINHYDSTGRHSVDPGPTYFSFAPIFSFMKEEPFMHFQFGQEMQYLTALEVQPVEKKESDSSFVDVYNFELMNAKISVSFNSNTQSPVSITAVIDSSTYKIIYEEYKTGLKIDSSLFLPPDPSRITEPEQ